MAKTATASTLSPYRFTTGLPVVETEARTVAEMLHWTACERGAVTHVAVNGATAAWGAGSIGALHLVYPTGSTPIMLRGRLYVTPGAVAVKVTLRSYADPADTLTTIVDVGGGTYTFTTTDADNGNALTYTLDVADTGTGWVTWTVALGSVGGSGNSYLYALTIREDVLDVSDLVDPEG